MVNLGFACLAYDITNFFLVFSFYGVDVLSLIWLLFLDKINKVIACLYPMAGETCPTWNSLYHDEENIYLGSKLLFRTIFFISVEIKKGIKIALKCSLLHAFLFSSVKVLYSKEYFRDKSRNHEAENLK
jgi:hypothetical protein